MNPISESFESALRQFQSGQLQAAEDGFRGILRVQPSHLDAMHLLGILLSQSGKHVEAVDRIRSAIALRPNTAVLHRNLGLALKAQGKLVESIDCYQQALRLKPDSADVYCYLGAALHGLGKLDDAIANYQQALRLNPNDPVTHNNLGTALEGRGKLDEAVVCYRSAIRLTPDYYTAQNNLGTALLKLNDLDEAVASYREALRLKPDDAGAHNNLGAALEGQGKLDEAVASYQLAIRLKPNDAVAYNNLGNALQKQSKSADAVACYQQALRLKPDYVVAQSNLGTTLQRQNKLDDAIACYQQALRLKPDYADAHHNLGMAWLQTGNLASGWSQYEWRIKVNRLPEFRQSKWDGSPLAGRRILILAEQGLGDTLQFIRYIPLVKARGGHVIVACQPPLMGLLKCVEEIDELIPQPTDLRPELPPFDVYSYLLSVPNLLGTTLDTIPHRVPYMLADERFVERWRQELGHGNELKVGIAWQGNRLNSCDRGRSIRLEEFEPLGQIQNVRLISLQKGDGSEQVRQLAWCLPVTDFTDRMDDSTGPFLDTAAMMMNLDLVITSDTSVAHLAGALGVPVWVALAYSPDWRWLLDRDDSPWYPTMRLFRQETTGDWAGVFRRIARELRRFGQSKGANLRAIEFEMPSQFDSVASQNSVFVETSIGELADKVSILAIKSDRMSDPDKLKNVRRELETLRATFKSVLRSMSKEPSSQDELEVLVSQLKSVNESLWHVEDDIRDCERSKDFGPKFVELARSVYHQNDLRAALKRQINDLLGSKIVEEKSYRDYKVPNQ